MVATMGSLVAFCSQSPRVALRFTRRPPGWVLYLAAVLVYPLPYYITYANAKYRHAIEPELALLGAYLVVLLYEEIEKARGRTATSANTAGALQ